ncbi:hypothetical protein AB0K08_14035 [Citricoccus sp. NPDC055426]|uniref:hypothetical protein n=1 Tax=Citricoccus sp. NPDC055426 TaxID=3155536 RepID=UPI003431DCCC
MRRLAAHPFGPAASSLLLRARATLLTGMDAARMGRLERLRNGAAIVLTGSVEPAGQCRIAEYNA